MQFLTGTVCVLLPVMVFCVFLLIRSLRRTFYAYRNIALIGTILFLLGLLGVLLGALFALHRSAEPVSGSALYQMLLTFPRRFSFYAVFVIFAVSVLVGVSNIALIRREGFCLHHLFSLILAGFYIGGAIAVSVTVAILERKEILPRGPEIGISLFLVLMLCYFECILAGTAVMGGLAARQKPRYDKDYIIILGCSIDKRGGLLPLLKGRVNRAIRFAWEQEIATGRPLYYVPSGGQGHNEVMSEGSAMELYLKTRGAEDDEVFPEKQSRDTWENMVFSKKIIDALKPDAKIAFATTNYHMLRSGILARKAGIDAEGIAGDTKWYFWPNGFVREFFGILALHVRAHLTVAVVTALLSAAVAVVGVLGQYV